MEFEELAAHFGYSLGVGAVPVEEIHAPRTAARWAAKYGRKL